MDKIRLSYSAINDWQTCPRKYYYAWQERRVRVGQNDRSLGFGTAFHTAQEALWGWQGDREDPEKVRLAVSAWNKAAAEERLSWEDCLLGQILTIGYSIRYDDLGLFLQGAPLVEQRVVGPVLDLNGNPDPDLEVTAVFDLVAYDEAGNTVVVEHKTTKSPIDPAAAYWPRLDRNLQASLYYVIASDHGRQVNHVLWDVVKAPELKRMAATPPEKREFYVKAGKWGDVGDPKPGTRLVDETAEEFASRIQELVLSNPNAFYARQPVMRSEEEQDRTRADLWMVGTNIKRAVSDGAFPRNPDACGKYNRDCPYIPVCWQGEDITDPKLYRIRARRDEKAEALFT